MKSTVSTLAKRLDSLEAKRGNVSVAQGIVWNYEHLIGVIRKRNTHNEIIRAEVVPSKLVYPKMKIEYTIWYYNDFESSEE